MNTVTALEAKTRLVELLDRVARGEEIVITRNEKPVARIVPEGGPTLSEVRLAVTELLEVREEIQKRIKGKGKLTDAVAMMARSKGRRHECG